MTETSFFKVRLCAVAGVTIAIGSLLAWNYFNGGIPRHHLFADKDLPSFSNAWGILLLPLLTWFLTGRIRKRIFNGSGTGSNADLRFVAYGFLGSLLYAITMATFFSLGYNDLIGNMMLAIFAIALFLPVYQSQYLLGFVLGMSVTFGAVLPTGIGTVLCAITAVIYLFIRRGVLMIAKRVAR